MFVFINQQLMILACTMHDVVSVG